MLYYFDKKNLTYEKATNKLIYLIFGLFVLSTLLLSLIFVFKMNETRLITEETKAIIIRESLKDNEFSPIKLKQYLLELNVRFPHIVYAQAELESGGFKSNLFKQNNNLFGMRVATRRPTINKGEENGFAYYDNWKESVIDYAMYSAAYLNDIKTEDEYFQYLAQNYAEAPHYVEALKKSLGKKNLVD